VRCAGIASVPRVPHQGKQLQSSDPEHRSGTDRGPRAGVRWLESHNEVEASFIAERETTW
jgi:hypothetical protein